MPLTAWQKLTFAYNRFMLDLVPPAHSRKPLTWSEIPSAFAYVVPYLFLAYLVRRRDTRTIRILLLPITAFLTIRGTFYYDFNSPDYVFYNWLRALLALTVLGKSIDFAFSKKGTFKIGETCLPAIHEDSSQSKDSHTHGGLLPSGFKDALETATTLRGIGWEMGKGVYIPPDNRPQERLAFLKATYFELIRYFLIMDVLVNIVQSVPGVGTPSGGTIFIPELAPVPRYAFSTLISIVAATGMISGFHVLHHIGTLLGVGLMGDSPAAWPPILNNSWSSDSISDLWAKRWHQMLRRVFIVYGGIPGGWIAGRPGFVLGTFFASALLHECSIWVIGRGLDHRVTFFFTFQGVCVILEVLWKKVTGYRVQGWGGRIWAYLIVLSTGQACLDAWLVRGVGGTTFIPPFLSPTQMILIPLFRRILGINQ
ncbi:hypothetical protein BDW22DRAFT_1483815 [Trametopsis cervina]|nr:hypothetical protein BDW22DRAFT_1483815 [Trametopsis cervina]